MLERCAMVRWTLGGGSVSVFSELCMRAICFVCGIEGVATCMLSAPYGVHAHCWKVLMFSQLDDFGGDYKD